MLKDLRSLGWAAAALEEQDWRPHRVWSSVCTFAKDTSWAVCRRKHEPTRDGGEKEQDGMRVRIPKC